MNAALRQFPQPIFLLFASLWIATAAGAAAPPPGVAEALAQGRAQDLIIEYDGSAVDREAADLRRQQGLRHDGARIVDLRRARYRRLKDGVLSSLSAADHQVVADFDALPLALMRVRTPRALAALRAHRNVIGIHRDAIKYPVPNLTPQLDSQSKSLIGQPVAAASGMTGAGTTVVVVDTGANYTVADLGSCTAAATPASCRISHALYVNTANQVVSDPNAATEAANSHGTNVAAIVAGVATGTQVAMINVFGTAAGASDSKILAAINWSIVNRAAHNIRAINLSLGDGVRHTSQCSSGNPYVSAIASARAAGIVLVAASGNDAYTNGINSPACTPGAVSVGAVYVANYGSRAWSACTDTVTAADKVACFSNSASFLTTLAPGAIITAGGLSYVGTSQAAPFVAATMSLLSNAYPEEGPSEWVAHLTAEAYNVTDSRNGLIGPRLDLGAIAAAVAAADGEVPTLPEWAMLCLGGLLLLGSTLPRTRQKASAA